MTPLVFFSFESISCYIWSVDFNFGFLCRPTSLAAVPLSLIVVVLTLVSIFSKTMPRSVHVYAAIEYSDMATLHLKWYNKQLQGILMVLTVLASLYLFSIFGTTAKLDETENCGGNRELEDWVKVVGVIGVVSIAIVFFINNVVLLKVRAQHKLNPVEFEGNKSSRRFTTTELEDGMIMASFV